MQQRLNENHESVSTDTGLFQSQFGESDYVKEPEIVNVNLSQPFRQTKWRWVMLLLICYYNLVSFFMIQIPTVLQDQYNQCFGANDFQYNMATAMISLPNIVLPLAVSPIAERIGMKKTIFLYTLLMILGMVLQFMGSNIDNDPTITGNQSQPDLTGYWILLGGISVFGIGVNGSLVILNSFTCMWFEGSEFSTALGSINAVQYFGQIICSLMLPSLYDSKNTPQQPCKQFSFPFMVSLIIMLTDFVVAMGMILIDKKANIEDRKNNYAVKEDLEKVEFSDILKFGKLFWIINMGTLIAWGTLQYNNNIQQLLNQEYGIGDVQAGLFIAMQFFIQLPLTPLISYFTDKYGKRAQMYILGSLINMSQFIYFIFAAIGPNQSYTNFVIPLIIGGIGNSFFGAVSTPMVAVIVEQKYLNSAFGIYGCMMQAGQGIFPFPMGYILDLKNTPKSGFQYFWYLCLIMSLLQLLNSVAVWIYDLKHGNKLDKGEGASEKIERTNHAIASHLHLTLI